MSLTTFEDRRVQAYECPPFEVVQSMTYDELRTDVELFSYELGVSDHIRTVTLALHDEQVALGRKRGCGEEFAHEILASVRFGVSVLEEILDFYQIEPTRAHQMREAFWSAMIIHDGGKDLLPAWLIKKSEEGKVPLTPEEFEIMKLHPMLGYWVAKDQGLSDLIARPVAEHHHRQTFNVEYGIERAMSDDEELVCAALRVAETTWAAITRQNTKYQGQSTERKWSDISKNIAHVFEHFDPHDKSKRDALVARIYKHAHTYFFPEQERAVA